MLMTPGLALFYGGMVQGKNVLSTFMHSFFALGLVSVQFAVIGYSLVVRRRPRRLRRRARLRRASRGAAPTAHGRTVPAPRCS